MAKRHLSPPQYNPVPFKKRTLPGDIAFKKQRPSLLNTLYKEAANKNHHFKLYTKRERTCCFCNATALDTGCAELAIHCQCAEARGNRVPRVDMTRSIAINQNRPCCDCAFEVYRSILETQPIDTLVSLKNLGQLDIVLRDMGLTTKDNQVTTSTVQIASPDTDSIKPPNQYHHVFLSPKRKLEIISSMVNWAHRIPVDVYHGRLWLDMLLDIFNSMGKHRRLASGLFNDIDEDKLCEGGYSAETMQKIRQSKAFLLQSVAMLHSQLMVKSGACDYVFGILHKAYYDDGQTIAYSDQGHNSDTDSDASTVILIPTDLPLGAGNTERERIDPVNVVEVLGTCCVRFLTMFNTRINVETVVDTGGTDYYCCSSEESGSGMVRLLCIQKHINPSSEYMKDASHTFECKCSVKYLAHIFERHQHDWLETMVHNSSRLEFWLLHDTLQYYVDLALYETSLQRCAQLVLQGYLVIQMNGTTTRILAKLFTNRLINYHSFVEMWDIICAPDKIDELLDVDTLPKATQDSMCGTLLSLDAHWQTLQVGEGVDPALTTTLWDTIKKEYLPQFPTYDRVKDWCEESRYTIDKFLKGVSVCDQRQ
jgi:hypothetical protein